MARCAGIRHTGARSGTRIETPMKVEIRLFASLRAKMGNGTGKGELELEEGTSLWDVITQLEIPPELAHMTLVNGQHCPAEQEWREQKKLQDGDIVSVFPPLAGGARRSTSKRG